MTKREMLRILAPYDDDTPILIAHPNDVNTPEVNQYVSAYCTRVVTINCVTKDSEGEDVYCTLHRNFSSEDDFEALVIE